MFQSKIHFLYALIGLMLSCNVPLMSLEGISFVAMPTLAMMAAILLAANSMYHFNSTYHLIGMQGKWLLCVALGYIFITTLVGTIQYRVPIQYPIWSLSIFFLWILVLPWLFIEENKEIIYVMSVGVLIGAVINSFAIIFDVWGMSPVLFIMKWFDVSQDISIAGPWGYLSQQNFFKASGGVGLFSYSRTATGFFLAISTALVFAFDIKKISVKILIQTILFVGILYTGSRLGFISWIFIMAVGYRAIGLRKQSLLIVYFVSFCIIGFQLGVFNERLQGRLIGYQTSYVEALTIRSGYHTGFATSDTSDTLYAIEKIPYYLFGSGAGNSGYKLKLKDSGHNMYSAHGFIFQYIADIGIVGLLLSILILIYGVRGQLQNKHLWGLYASFLLCGVVADFFFAKTSIIVRSHNIYYYFYSIKK